MKSSVEDQYQKPSLPKWNHTQNPNQNQKKKAKAIFDELVLYEARDCISRQKLISHFGVDCAIRTGAGSRLKLENIYGGSHANVVTSKRRKSDSSLPLRWTFSDVNPIPETTHASTLDRPQQSSSIDPIVQPVMIQKLYGIFGRDAAIDIPFEEIEKYGLGYLIQSSVPLAYFIEYLLMHNKSEIMFFFMDVISFEETIFPDANAELEASQDILTTYLCSNSPMECKISPRTRCQCIKAIKAGQRRCFKSSQQELLPILESQFDEFKNSKKYSELKNCYGHLNAYPDNKRLELIQKLLSTTNRKYPVETAETQQKLNSNKAILYKVQKFCRNKLSNSNSFKNKLANSKNIK